MTRLRRSLTTTESEECLVDANGSQHVLLASLLSGEDQQNSVLRVQTGGPHYETVAASQSDQALGATGAAGDYLGRLVLIVSTAATAAVSIKDGAGSAIAVFPNSPGGGVGTYTIELGIKSASGAWKVTTASSSR